MNAPSSDVAPLTSSSLPTALDAGRVAGASPAIVEENSLNALSSDVVPLARSSPSAAPDAWRWPKLLSRKLLFWLLLLRRLAKAQAK